jgi:hypothetical protein
MIPKKPTLGLDPKVEPFSSDKVMLMQKFQATIQTN